MIKKQIKLDRDARCSEDHAVSRAAWIELRFFACLFERYQPPARNLGICLPNCNRNLSDFNAFVFVYLFLEKPFAIHFILSPIVTRFLSDAWLYFGDSASQLSYTSNHIHFIERMNEMSQDLEIVGEAPGNNIQAFIDLTLLNCNLKGVYQVFKNGETGEKKTKILVMPTDPEPQSMTLKELIAEINNVIQSFGKGEKVTEESMEATLDSMGLKKIEDIRVQIRQLFIYIDSSSIEANSKPCEYAFNFVILNPVNPDESLKLFNIKSLGLAVYNTDRKKIIERMQLENIDELLA
ncbi:hypothetical protein [Paenibacillus albilobatus]|nr:hypothetical protein [Paenibacillus albilobatus]